MLKRHFPFVKPRSCYFWKSERYGGYLFRNRNAGAGQHGEGGHSCPLTPVPSSFTQPTFNKRTWKTNWGRAIDRRMTREVKGVDSSQTVQEINAG